MRSYYEIIITEPNSAYRKPLHEQFRNKYPDLDVTEQRVADQKRAIENRKLISEMELKQIEDETRQAINGNGGISVDMSNQTEGTDGKDAPNEKDNLDREQQPTSQIKENEEGEIVQKTKNEFEKATAEYLGNDPEHRPRIPQIWPNKKTWQIILNIINKNIMPECMAKSSSLLELVGWVYCAAITVVRMTSNRDIKNKSADSKSETKRERDQKPQWQKRNEIRIKEIRKHLGQLTQYKNGSKSNKLDYREK